MDGSGPDRPRTQTPGVSYRMRLWLGVGSFVLLGPRQSPLRAGQATAPARVGSEGGEQGGEGGEGGIDAARAGTDPVAFILALDIVAAHYLAGRLAYQAGHAGAAAELFAHPISEIYVELEPVFQARGVVPFQEIMERASRLALDKAPQAAIAAAVEAVLAALAAAEAKAPGPGPTLGVSARVVGALIDRAALQHAAAIRSPELEPYLDGLGFFLVARSRAATVVPALNAAGHGTAAEAIRSALLALAPAYPGIARPAQPLPPGPLTAQAARLKFMLEDLR